MTSALLVYIPVGNYVVINHVYRGSKVVVASLAMLVGLLLSNLAKFDVILGMVFP